MICDIKEYNHKNGAVTKYAVFGNGKKTFVMIPGLSIKSVMLSADVAAEAYSLFWNDFTVYLFDRPYPAADGIEIDGLAESLYETLTALNITEAYFLGVSQGGMILQRLTVNHGEIIKKAVFASTASRTDANIQDKIGEWIRLAKSGEVKKLHLKFFEDVYSEELLNSLRDSIDSLIPECTDEELRQFTSLALACNSFNMPKSLKDVRIPALVIGSEKDKLMSISSQEELAKLFNAEFYLYSDYSHAVYDEAPNFKQIVYDFFLK